MQLEQRADQRRLFGPPDLVVDPTREHWRAAISERAQSYWTVERERELTSGKDLLITPSVAAPLLRSVGLIRADASMPDAQVRKYLQLNHMIWLLGPPIRELIGRGKPIHIVDAGCGLAYLTVALAWCFEHVYRHPAHIVGVDRREDLVESCRERAEQAGLSNILDFECRTVNESNFRSLFESFEPEEASTIVMGLHACDTATDDAITLGIQDSADLIAVAPCCQAELASRWSTLHDADGFGPIRSTPHLRREAAATITDAMRGLLLEAAGYEVRTVEFVASEHTPKNTLIRAMKRRDSSQDAWSRYQNLRHTTGGVGITLEDVIASYIS